MFFAPQHFLCSLSHAGSRLDYQYDPHGRLTGYSQNAGAAGQRLQTVIASGQTLSYHRDTMR